MLAVVHTSAFSKEFPMQLRSLIVTAFGLVLGAAALAAGEPLPAWAYPWVPDFKLPADDGVPRRVPDSTAVFTITQERDLFFAPDWHPADHPQLPEVVARGRKPEVRACGSCHRAEGTGGPENASLAGLPAAYIIQQILDYKSGARKFSGPARSPNVLMTAVANAMNEEEIKAAAAYFSALKPKSVTTVVETETVPKTFIARVFVAKVPGNETEPLGQRIVEVPVDMEQFEHRDTRSKFIAYVQPGSIARGEALVKTGGAGSTMACATCHGADLKGLDAVPSIAGRSPSYIVRQLYDIQQGTRAGAMSALMKPVVEKLTSDDMNAIAAYLASRQP
jgi:cytochrome c553